MSVIVPAVLPTSKKHLADTLARLAAVPGIDFVQIDAVDGRFASPASWPYAGVGPEEFAQMIGAGEMLPEWGRLKFDVDLMVREPEQVTGAWITAGTSRLTVHLESTNYLPQIVTDLRHKYGHDKDFAPDLLSFGLAINVDTALDYLEEYIGTIDYVQIMGISHIGKQGEPFDQRVFNQVRALRARHPDMVIQVDGAVTKETAPELLSAGVDRLIVGHDLLQAPDIAQEFKLLSELAASYGRYERP